MKLFCLASLLISLALAAAPSAVATENSKAAAAAAAVDFSGVWQLTVEVGGGGGSPTFHLTQDGEKLTGRYVGALGEADVTGTTKGPQVEFGFVVRGRDLRVRYVGTVDGDTMKGKVVFGGMGEGTFTGTKQAKK